MLERNLIERAREIQRKLNAEAKASEGLSLRIDDYEQRTRYAYYVRSGSPIRSKNVFASYIPDVHETNLYVHVPFCVNRCTYCCYFSVAKQPNSVLAQYVTSLKKELELLIKTSRFENAVIRHIYFGGGTPTLFSAHQLSDLIQYLRSRLTILPNVNFTCEISPETTVGRRGKERLQALLENGVNRLSLGVQSFDDRVLELIGRSHTSDTAMAAYRNACEAGFRNLNIDLMFGLPGQTVQSWERDLEIATDLKTGWISLSRLRFDNPAIHETYTKDGSLFPEADTMFLMNIMAVEKVTESGYQQAHAPVSFRLPCKEQLSPRHWLGEQELAIGAGAWSYLNGVRYSNVRNVERYVAFVDKGRLPISFAGKYSKRQQMEKQTILMLRLPKGVNRREFNTRFGIDIGKMFVKPLNRLREAGMITDDGETFRLSYKGLVLASEVFKEFYSENLVDGFKNMVYHNRFLRRLFLRKKYSRYVEGLSSLVKTAAGVSKWGQH